MSSDKTDEDKSKSVEDCEEAEESGGQSTSTETTDAGFSTSGLSVEALRSYLAKKLGFYKEDESAEHETIKVLDDVSLKGIVQYIKANNCTNIITMAGAGISTTAGIPDFRSPGSGLYHNLLKYKLPHPQAIFELDFFHENPKPFFELAKELYPGCFKPTISHYFIRLLHEKGLLLRHYTQNIDTLERVAGIPAEKLVEAHGTFHTGHCLECRKEYTQDWMKVKIFKDEIPICDECPGIVKPDIVFFGENLPSLFHDRLVEDFPICDLLIVLGSSLVVQPFASLIDRVNETCPRLLINREKAGHRTGIMAMMGMKGGMDFDGPGNTRDVAYLGNCDEGCELMAEMLGFHNELMELLKKEHDIIDLENATEAIDLNTSICDTPSSEKAEEAVETEETTESAIEIKDTTAMKETN